MMNRNELHGGARYVGGKIEKGIGDVADSRSWQVDGVIDQVAGGAEHLYGRARSIAEDAVDAAPGLIEEARTKAEDAARRGTRVAKGAVEDQPLIWALAAAAGGYALAWLIHGRRG